MPISLTKLQTSPRNAVGRQILHPQTGRRVYVTRAQEFRSQPEHIRLTLATPNGATLSINVPVHTPLRTV